MTPPKPQGREELAKELFLFRYAGNGLNDANWKAFKITDIERYNDLLCYADFILARDKSRKGSGK